MSEWVSPSMSPEEQVQRWKVATGQANEQPTEPIPVVQRIPRPPQKHRPPVPPAYSGNAEALQFLRYLVLWPLKMLGLYVTIFAWPFTVGYVVTSWVPGFPGVIVGLLIMLAWYLLFLKGFLTTFRWIDECEKALRLGKPCPRWGYPKLRKGLWRKFCDWQDRSSAKFSFTGLTLHPSEDGVNDLGQTAGFSRYEANRLTSRYREVRITRLWHYPRCRNCGHTVDGSRMCSHCGTYILGNGEIDYEAEAQYERHRHGQPITDLRATD